MTPRQQIETKGYYVAAGLLSPAETDRLRTALGAHFPARGVTTHLGRHQAGAAAAIPDLAWLFTCPQLLSTLRSLLDTDRLVFTGNCDAHNNLISAWHRDAGGRHNNYFRGDPLSRDSFRLCRVGVYLQDHVGDDRGFKARPGSHRRKRWNDLPLEKPDTVVGDVTFHDTRLVHAGILPDRVERVMLAVGRRLGWPAWTTSAKEVWWRVANRPSRGAAFFSFGAADPDTEEFCRVELQDRRRQLGPEKFRLSPSLLAALADAGVLTYEAALTEQFGPDVLDRFAETGELPEERVWS